MQEAIDALEQPLREQVILDIEKMETRGIRGAVPPLAKHLDGDVYYVRSEVHGCGWFRTFYFRSGRTSFYGFAGYFKNRDKLPRRVVEQVMEKCQQYQNMKER